LFSKSRGQSEWSIGVVRQEIAKCKLGIVHCKLVCGARLRGNFQWTICNSPKAEVAVFGIKRFVDAAAH
jgi:hypothetical protein